MQNQAKGFFASLFDITFSSLITTKIIKVLYVLSLILIGLAYIVWVAAAFAADEAFGALVLLILGPLAALFWAIVVRVYLEVVIALFRVMETNIEIAANTSRGAPPPRGGPSPPPAPPPPDSTSRIA